MKTLRLRDITYSVANGVNLTGASNLYVVGPSTIKATANPNSVFTISNCSSIACKDIIFDASSADRTSDSAMTISIAGSSVTFERCTFTGTIHHAVLISQSSHVTFRECVFDGNVTHSNGAYIYSNSEGNRLSFYDCVFNNVGGADAAHQALYLYLGAAEFYNCAFTNCGQAVDIRATATALVSGCSIAGGVNGRNAVGGAAIRDRGSGTVIRDCHLSGIEANNICWLYGDGGLVEGCIITGLNDGSKAQNIFTVGGANTRIVGNQITGTQYGNSTVYNLDNHEGAKNTNLIANVIDNSRWLYRIVVEDKQLLGDVTEQVSSNVLFVMANSSYGVVDNPAVYLYGIT